MRSETELERHIGETSNLRPATAGVATLNGEHVQASACTRHMDGLGLVRI